MSGNLDFKGNKGFRLIYIFERLSGGELLKKRTLAQDLSVSEKSIQRDIQDLRLYLAETRFFNEEIEIKYDKTRNGYYLNNSEKVFFTNKEILILSKILVGSRGFRKNEIELLMKKLFQQATPSVKTRLAPITKTILTNIPTVRNNSLIEKIWTLTTFILEEKNISFTYQKGSNCIEKENVKPVSIILSDEYFFLTIISEEKESKSYKNFRVDKIENISIKEM